MRSRLRPPRWAWAWRWRPPSPPAYATAWIAGFLRGAGLVLIHHRALFDRLDTWLGGLAEEVFREIVPLLRRAFAEFSAPERRQLLELAGAGPAAPLAAAEALAFDWARGAGAVRAASADGYVYLTSPTPTMPLQATYDALRQAALPRLARGAADLDPLLDSPQDTRRGITLLTRPPAPIAAALAEMMADFQLSEPTQYYYPPADIHLTILSIISCYPDFKLREINPASYCFALRQIIQFIPPFRLTYQGLTASAGGILVQGFPRGNGLNELRTAIRNLFQHADLQQSIDKRYNIQTAHSTIIRFKSPLHNPAKLLANLKKYERHFFGTFEVSKLELVYNDWYQRAENTVVLDEYLLSR